MLDADLSVIKLKRKLHNILKLINVPILIGHVDEKSKMIKSAMSLRKILKETHFNINLLDYFS
jgi:hypothetical protein